MKHAHAVPPHLLAFWRSVESLVQTLFSLFGGPELVAQRHSLVREDHRLLSRWLRAGEAFLRRLILIEAAQTPVILKPKCKAKKPIKPRATTLFDPDHPETWRVSFRMSFAQSARGFAKSGEARRVYDALPLAKRFEALLRAYNNPSAIIARLAKKLQRAPLDLSSRLFSEKVHPETGAADHFDQAGMALEAAIKTRSDSS